MRIATVDSGIISQDEFDGIDAEITALENDIAARAEKVNATVDTSVLASRPVTLVREVPPILKAASAAAKAARKKVRDNSELSQQGKLNQLAAIDAAVKAEVDNIGERTIKTQAAALRALHPAAVSLVPPADISAFVTSLFAGAEWSLPSRMLRVLIDYVRRGMDLKSPMADQVRANLIIENGVLPLVLRFAAAPPKHWAQYSNFCQRLADVATMHSDITFDRAQHQTAVNYADAFESQFRDLAAMTVSGDGWDDTLAPLYGPLYIDRPKAA